MPSSQTRFSPAASRVFSWAKDEAKRLQSPQIEPEHLLLGLMLEKKGLAYFAIQAVGKNLSEMETLLRNSLKEIPTVVKADIHFSEETQMVIEKGADSADLFERQYLGTEHLLLGLLRGMETNVYSILRKFNITYANVISQVKKFPPESFGNVEKLEKLSGIEEMDSDKPPVTLVWLIKNISPIFIGMIVIVIFTGMSAYFNWGNTRISIFYFVTFSWVISLSLHEFGHAIVAYIGGDKGVVEKGYLSLNPLKYTHGFLSIVMPLLFLAMGGIGLPGGAVFIDMTKIKSRGMQSLLSFAGPLMNMIFAFGLSIPFIFNLISEKSFLIHWEFWAGISFLIFIQITAIFFNLFPLPGLDGFGIIRPFLPDSILKLFMAIRPFSLLILFIFIMRDSQIGITFWNLMYGLVDLIGIDINNIGVALHLYRFWQ